MTEEEQRVLLENKIKSLILPKTELVFVHIPKNAGTTISRVMFQRSKGIGGHLTASMINSVEEYKNHKNFLFCKDPFDRFVSVYLWRLRKDELVQRLTIEEVIERLSNSGIRQPTKFGFENAEDKLDRMFLAQTDWMNHNTVYVGRTENTNKDMLELKKQYNLDFPLQDAHHNPAKTFGPQPKPTRALLIKILNDSTSLRNTFFDYYSKDYEEFGYNVPKELK